MNGQQAMHEGDKVTMFGEEFEVISVYTRKQAIEDGVLVDLSGLFPNDTRIYKYPVACTMTVWGMIEDACERTREDAGAYVWDLCWMSANMMAVVKDDGDMRLFRCAIPLGGKAKLFKVVVGPGDDGVEPVITIMMPDED
jgi:hypothetical protein